MAPPLVLSILFGDQRNTDAKLKIYPRKHPTSRMLSLVLDAESEQYLVEILAQEKTTSGNLIKLLLRDRWRSLQTQTLIPQHLPRVQDETSVVEPESSSEELADFNLRRSPPTSETSLTSLVGSAQGGFATAEEADTFIRQEL